MNLDPELRERVHTLWDSLADFDAAQIDDALTHLLESLCTLVDAENADWTGVVRLVNSQRNDQTGGWRPPVVHFLHPNEAIAKSVRERIRLLGQNVVGEAVARIFAQSGRFRAHRLCDVVESDWFQQDFYRTYYRDCGLEDAIYVAFPVNEDAESYFGIFRLPGRPHFTPQERDLLAYALRGIKWFHRQLLLSHGFLIATKPMTPMERRVLQSLLTGQTEKEIAADLGQSYHTTHEYVTAIYRKFGVNNRPALMALWLGNGL